MPAVAPLPPRAVSGAAGLQAARFRTTLGLKSSSDNLKPRCATQRA